MSKSDLNCSFCGKKKDQTSLLIAGIDAHICDLCIEQANGIIIQENKSLDKTEDKTDLQVLKPQQIKLFLDDYIIGQDYTCLLYTSPSPRDATLSRMPSSA